MKRLNNKGMTTIEVIICFVLVVLITISMYTTISSYSTKVRTEENKAVILNYKEVLRFLTYSLILIKSCKGKFLGAVSSSECCLKRYDG